MPILDPVRKAAVEGARAAFEAAAAGEGRLSEDEKILAARVRRQGGRGRQIEL